MNIDEAVKNLKVFRKWFCGSGRKYMYHMPEGITHGQIGESLKTAIGFIPNTPSIEDLRRLAVAADAHTTRLKNNRKDIIDGLSKEEIHDFDTHLSDLAKSVRNSKKIIRRLQKIQKMEVNLKAN